MIRNLIDRCISIFETSRQMSIDRRIVRKYAQSDGCPGLKTMERDA